MFHCISGGEGSIILQKLASVRYWLAVDDTGRSEVDERNEERKLFGMLSHTVTDIQTQSVIQVPSGVRWPEVHLSRSFKPVDDFKINFDISWDSYDDSGLQRNAAMQFFLVKLYDDTDNFLSVQSGYVDGWVYGTARQHAQINSNDYWSGPNSLPYADSAQIEIIRNNGVVEFF